MLSGMTMPATAPPKKKTPWWVIVLIVFGVFSLLGLLVIGGIVWWVASNKDRLVAEGKVSVSEAEAFAASHDQNACVDESLRKMGACDGIMCEAQSKVFLTMCLQRAERSPALCEGVPPAKEILKTSSWVVDECRRRGKGTDQRCTRLLQAVPQVCHNPSED
jgi:hypothetical protein